MPFEPMTIGSRTFDFTRPYIVGIINVTPDSFSDGGRWLDAGEAVRRGLELVEEGADIVDVGGESTRPGARPVPAPEEKERVLPVIRQLRRAAAVPISIDTTKAEVAEAALGEGADLVNDVSALRFDPELAAVAARHGAPVVLMHSRRTPADMQQEIRYRDLMGEIVRELGEAMRTAAEHGVGRASVIVDPGLGFAKTAEHNLQVLAGLERLASLGRPVMVGPSRKSFIGHVTGAPVSDRAGGTAAAVAAAVLAGANFLRVHDVRVMKQAAEIAFSIRKSHSRATEETDRA